MSWTPAGMFVVSTLLPALGTATVVARFYVRKEKGNPLCGDDWLAFGAMLGMWAMAGVTIAGTTRDALGTHTAVDPTTHRNIVTAKDSRVVECEYLISTLLPFTIGLIKLSIILLYRRIFQVSRTLNIYTLVLQIVMVLWTTSFVLAFMLQCGKRPWAYWTSHKTAAMYCVDGDQLQLVPLIWRLRMSLSEKLQVTSVFAMGYLSTAFSAVRAYINLRNVYQTRYGHRDIAAVDSQNIAFAMIYVSVAMMASCLPTLKPLFRGTRLGKLFHPFKFQSSTPAPLPQPEIGVIAVESIGGTAFGGKPAKHVYHDAFITTHGSVTEARSGNSA